MQDVFDNSVNFSEPLNLAGWTSLVLAEAGFTEGQFARVALLGV